MTLYNCIVNDDTTLTITKDCKSPIELYFHDMLYIRNNPSDVRVDVNSTSWYMYVNEYIVLGYGKNTLSIPSDEFDRITNPLCKVDLSNGSLELIGSEYHLRYGNNAVSLTYSQIEEIISTKEKNRVFALGKGLSFLLLDISPSVVILDDGFVLNVSQIKLASAYRQLSK